jgi:hypothetical protein
LAWEKQLERWVDAHLIDPLTAKRIREFEGSMLANSILHRVLTDPFLYGFISVIALPLLLWTWLAKFAQSHPDILPRIYLPLKILAWILWSCAVAAGSYSVFGPPGLKVFAKTGILISNFSLGLNLMYTWVRRRVDPDSFKKEDGWWPAPKDSSGSGIRKDL